MENIIEELRIRLLLIALISLENFAEKLSSHKLQTASVPSSINAIIFLMDTNTSHTYTPVASSEARPLLKPVTTVYTDVDGTLLAPGGRALVNHAGTPSSALAQTLVALKDAGIDVIPVSGRTRVQLIELARILDFEGFLAEMGTVGVTGQGSTATVRIHAAATYEEIESLGAIAALFAMFPGKLEYHTPWERNREVSHLLRGSIDVEQAKEALAGYEPTLTILDNGIIHPPKHTLAVEEDTPIHSYHVLPAGITKAEAVAKDIQQRGLSPEQTASIGDSYTDLLAAEHTGCAVLLKNALEDERVRELLGERNSSQDDSNSQNLQGSSPRPVRPVLATSKLTVDGWVEFGNALLDARS